MLRPCPYLQVGWLRGSHLHQLATEIRRAADATWQELQPLLAAAEQQGVAPSFREQTYSREAITWALSLLLSRLIRLPALGDVEALVPWADFLNHDCRAEAFLDFDPASAAVVLRADRQYRPGEQVRRLVRVGRWGMRGAGHGWHSASS